MAINKHKKQYDELYSNSDTKSWADINKDYIFTPYRVQRKMNFVKNNIYPVNNMYILDAGCGFGEIIADIYQNFKDYNPVFTDCDISTPMINSAKKRFENAEYILSAVEDIPFPDNTFDYVISVAVLAHVIDQKKAIREMVRVLKPCGKLIITTPNHDRRNIWEQHKITKLLLTIVKYIYHKASNKYNVETTKSPKVKYEELGFNELEDLVELHRVNIIQHTLINATFIFEIFMPKLLKRKLLAIYDWIELHVTRKFCITQVLVGVKQRKGGVC